MSRGSTSESPQASIVQVNESVYELYKPPGTPNLQIVFFHGLQEGKYLEAHWSTWQSGDGSCVWPQTWLVEEFRGAQVFCVSYSGGLETMSHVEFDIFLMSEIIMSDLIRANIGQVPLCPVVLVGHSIGGLLIKELCCHSDQMPKVSPDFGKEELEKFFNNLKGMVFYATPNQRSPVANGWAAIAGNLWLKFFITLLKDTEWLNIKFNEMCEMQKWLLAELWEQRPAKSRFLGRTSGVFQTVVPEPSARGEKVNVVEKADHFSISRPWTKISSNFSILKDFLRPIVNDAKEERRRRGDENIQHLPDCLVGIDMQQSLITCRLETVKTMGFVGTKGIGKSTLAMAVFNELGPKFEFSCYVTDVKLFKGDARDLKDYVWKHTHRHGKKIGNEPNWSELEGKQLLLVLDDISDADDRDKKVFLEIVKTAAQDSRFILTSRDLKLLQSFQSDIYSVPFLEDDSAEQLFMNHALPNYKIPPFLEFTQVIKDIVKHCEGLPISLEVLGKYLRTKQNESGWKLTLRALNKAQKEKIFDQGSWEKLKLFYEALEEREQQIFKESIRGGQHFKKLHEKADVNLYHWYEDPVTWEKMCDPVVCSDGRTYDRWTIIDQRLTRSPFDRSMTTFAIQCDNIDVRSKLFGAFPEQESKFRKRRLTYREEALQHARTYPAEVAEAIEKLSNILKWLPLDKECQNELSSLLKRLSQEADPPLGEDVLLGVPPVMDESQISPPESPEGTISGVDSSIMVVNQTSRIAASTQEAPAYVVPMVTNEDLIRSRGVIDHEDLIRARARTFENQLSTFLLFLCIAIMFFIA